MNYMGVDISTARTGIAIIDEDENIVACMTDNLSLEKTHKEKRRVTAINVFELITRFGVDRILLEKVRLFSYGGNKNYISFTAIYRLIACATTVSDMVGDIPIYTCDPRSWKSRVLGSSKAGKEGSVDYVLKKYGLVVNHDLADAICIAIYLKRNFDMCKKLE